jgi:iron complex outermembrane receptor protein
VALVTALSFVAAPAQAVDLKLADKVRVDLTGERLSDALVNLSESANLSIAFSSQQLAELRAPTVSGVYSVREILDQVLKNSGLTYEVMDDRTVRVVQAQLVASDAEPLPPSPARQAAMADKVDEIVVTGSRIARTETEGVVPISMVSQEDLRLAAPVNMESLLNSTPQFTAAGSGNTRVGPGVATLNLRGLGANRTLVLVDGRRFVPYDQNLITDINTIPSQFVERVEVVTGGSSAIYGSDAVAGVVNFILKKNFEGVEAYGQYRAFTEGDGATRELGIAAGGQFAGDRGRAMLSINRVERDRVSQAARPYGVYLVEAKDAQGRPILVEGGPLGSPYGRYAGIPTGAALNTPANAGLATALNAAGLNGMSSLGFLFNQAGTAVRNYDSNTDYIRPGAFMALQQPQERWAINGYADYDVGDRASIFTQFAFASNHTENSTNPESIAGNFVFDANNPYLNPQMREVLHQLDLRDGAVDGRTTLSINRSMEEVGPRTNLFDRTAFQIVVGSHYDAGDIGEDWLNAIKIDGYYSLAEAHGRTRSLNQNSITAFTTGVLRGADGSAPLINPFGANLSPAAAASLRLNTTSFDDTRQQTVNVSATGKLFNLPAGPVQAALGGEWRKSQAAFQPDELQRLGLVSGDPLLPTNGTINVWEAFSEVRAPIVSGVTLIDDLAVSGAFRYSSYDNAAVGGVWTYFGGAEWKPVSSLLLRGQYQRAIRAPNVAELYSGQSPSNPVSVDPCAQASAATNAAVRNTCIATGVPAALVGTVGVQPSARVDSLTGGNPNLKAEDARTSTLGLVFEPPQARGLQFSLDYFKIKMDGTIAPLGGGTSSILNLCYNVIQRADSTICRAIQRNPVDGTIVRPYRVIAANQNIGERNVAGYDFALRYARNMDAMGFVPEGLLSFGLEGTYYTDNDTTPVADLPNQVNKCVGGYGTVCGEPFPRLRMSTRVTYTTGPVEISVRHRYIGDVTLDTVLLPLRQGVPGPAVTDLASGRIGAQQYFDLSLGYDWKGVASFTAGLTNVFDRNPPVVARTYSEFFTFPSTYDPLGRAFYATVKTKF